MNEFVEYADGDALAAGLAEQVAADLARALTARGRATLAVPGGSTPAPFLTALAGQGLEWSRIAVCPTDERWAPPEHERSNEGMIRRALLANGASPTFLPFWRAGMTPEAAAPSVAHAFAPFLPIDVCVIGMGTDMHCASLFPGGKGLEAAMDPNGKDVIAPLTAPGAPEPRITLTAARLAEATKVYLLITGAEKRAAMLSAYVESDVLKAPVGAILRRAACAETHWAP
ncbi:MAG: 6-phosphogluconolactonase [Pikeienuella sp.]